MGYFLTVLFVIISCVSALADGVPTGIGWKDWHVSSSENLYAGHIHTSYPLTYLFDQDPRTAWVFSGKGKCMDGGWGNRYALRLVPHKPVVMDSIWIMNGYNRSSELFLRNNRVVEVKISVNGKMVKISRLSDKMGWHILSIPRQTVQHIQLNLTGFHKGSDNDVCLSELALYNGGRKIDMQMPGAVLFCEGDECGCGATDRVISRSGKSIPGVPKMDEFSACGWHPDGRFLAGTGVLNKQNQLWVLDCDKETMVFRKDLPVLKSANEYCECVRWIDRRKIEVWYEFQGGDKKEKPPEKLRFVIFPPKKT